MILKIVLIIAVSLCIATTDSKLAKIMGIISIVLMCISIVGVGR